MIRYYATCSVLRADHESRCEVCMSVGLFVSTFEFLCSPLVVLGGVLQGLISVWTYVLLPQNSPEARLLTQPALPTHSKAIRLRIRARNTCTAWNQRHAHAHQTHTSGDAHQLRCTNSPEARGIYLDCAFQNRHTDLGRDSQTPRPRMVMVTTDNLCCWFMYRDKPEDDV